MPADLAVHAPEDFLGTPVPLSERKGPVFMGLLWVTMVTGFATLYAGFDFYQHGLSLLQTLVGSSFGVAVLLIYTLFAAYLGSKSGQTYAMLTRAVYGRAGSWFVSLLVVGVSLLWYGFQVAFLVQLLDPFLHFGARIVLAAAIFATLMGITNYFGFKGVAGYARYVSAPVVLGWVGITALKAFATTPPSLLWGGPHPASGPTPSLSVIALAGIVIGYGVWGNEPDFWRFGKPRFLGPTLPLAFAMTVGLVLFPVTGWVLAAISGATSLGAAIAFETRYALGGLGLLAMAVFILTAMSNNDPNLYEAVNALQNVTQWPRKRLVLLLWPIGVLMAMALCRGQDVFNAIASAAAVLLPCATVVMATDAFVLPRMGLTRPLDRVVPWSEVGGSNWPALVSTLLGLALGLATDGTFPQLWLGGRASSGQPEIWGIPPLQSWLFAVVCYLAMAWIWRKQPRMLGLPEQRPRELEPA